MENDEKTLPLNTLALNWLGKNWVTGAAFMAAGFVALVPAIASLLPLGLFLIFLHTPGYMIHQVEEHQGDRFRRFVNYRMFGGLNVLRVSDVLVINLPLVWGLNLGAFYAALAWGAGYGLVAPYTMLVNAVSHFGTSIRFKSYNPGVVTSALIFVPLSVLTIWIVGTVPSVGFTQHLIGFGLAILIHALIMGGATGRFAALRNGISD
jgi:hypothetical protein